MGRFIKKNIINTKLMSYIRRSTNCVKSVQIRIFSGPCFPAFGLNMERYGLSVPSQSEWRKIRTRKNSVFRHFSYSDKWTYHWCQKELQGERISKFETNVHKTSESLFFIHALFCLSLRHTKLRHCRKN